MPPRTWLLTALTVTSLACRKPEPPPGPALAPPAPLPAPTVKATPEPPKPESPPNPGPEPTIRVAEVPPGAEPDPRYGVRVGDRAVLWQLYRDEHVALVAEDWLSFRELERAILAGDRDGILNLLGAGRVIEAPLGTEVLVLEVHGDPDHPRDTDPVLVRVYETDGSSFRVWTPRVCVVQLTR